MASTINAKSSGAGGIEYTGDSSGVLQLQTANTTAVTIDTSQNVGIGTTSPTYKLDTVSATNAIAKFTYSTVSSVMYNSTGSGTAYWGDQNVQNAFGINSASAYVSAWTNNVERMRIDSSGNLQFNSGYGSAATAYGCRAWVNFNGGNGNTAGVINGSGNVSSITVNGTGDYTVNFTNAMPDANYAVFGCLKPPTAATSTNGKVLYVKWDTAPTTSAVRVTTNSTGGVENEQYCYVTIFR